MCFWFKWLLSIVSAFYCVDGPTVRNCKTLSFLRAVNEHKVKCWYLAWCQSLWGYILQAKRTETFLASWCIQAFCHNRKGPKKWGALSTFLGGELGLHLAQCSVDRGSTPCQLQSWSIQPFDHNRHGPKIGGLCPLFGEGELRLHLT